MTDLNFIGRVAIVTGAGRGMGRGHALLLASRGAAVVVNDNGCDVDGKGFSKDPADSVVAEIRAAGGRAIANYGDARAEETGDSLVTAAIEEFGNVDILVANAGITRFADFADTNEDILISTVETHLYGTFRLARAAWPHMMNAGYGRIVTVPSQSTWGLWQLSAYNSAKAGILGLTKTLAVEGAEHGILANGIAPAAWTRMSDKAAEVGQMPPDQYEFAKRATPVQPNSAIVAYLAHESNTLTGQMLTYSGARMARLAYAETEGVPVDVDAPLSPEQVAASIGQIMEDTVRYEWPNSSDLLQHTQAQLRERDEARERVGR
ncbi:SDR family NAD(P)-dependent oxidoreductase [Nocardia vinacea]|uniref:SDR family NAD(P)-dependent oxidoreductase n=1 Tax=Nocardia vinacea TaxID=96468 RepID=UPI0005929B7E|nr:SDR family NAD(P)-dependent oxidoreductase [Nocardia vinacea]